MWIFKFPHGVRRGITALHVSVPRSSESRIEIMHHIIIFAQQKLFRDRKRCACAARRLVLPVAIRTEENRRNRVHGAFLLGEGELE